MRVGTGGFESRCACLRLVGRAEGVTARRPRFSLRASVAPCEKSVSRVTDRLGNHRLLDYGADGSCTRLSRRAGGILASAEPVRSFAYDRAGRLAAVSFAYDRYNRLVATTDPCGIVTRRTYADHGGLAKVERLDGKVEVSHGATEARS